MISSDQSIRQSLALAFLRSVAPSLTDYRSVLGDTAAWVMTGEWPNQAQKALTPVGGLKPSTDRERFGDFTAFVQEGVKLASRPNTMAKSFRDIDLAMDPRHNEGAVTLTKVLDPEPPSDRALRAAIIDPDRGSRRQDRLAALLLRLVDEQQPMPNNRDIGLLIDMPADKVSDVLPLLEAAGFGRVEAVGSGQGTCRRYILADGRSTPMSGPAGRMQAKPVAANAVPVMDKPDQGGDAPTPARTSADAAPVSPTQAQKPHGGLAAADPAAASARIPEDDHVTGPADTGHAPEAAAPPLGVGAAPIIDVPAATATETAPAADYDRNRVDPAGTRKCDHLAAVLLDLVESGSVMLTNIGLLKRLKERFNGAWHVATEDTVGSALSYLKSVGFCRAVPIPNYPRRGNEAVPRILTLWDGRQTAAPTVSGSMCKAPAPAITPNRNTGLLERRPSPAAKTPRDRDVSPDLRAMIEDRVARGAVTIADRPGYAAPTDANANGTPVYPSAGGNRRAAY